MRKVVLATAAVTTLAGGSVCPSGGSGLACTYNVRDAIGANAMFGNPRAVAVDGAGNVLVTDGLFLRYIVAATGNVTTPAGLIGGTTYVNSGNSFGDGVGTNVGFGAPSGIAVDAATGIAYVADTNTTCCARWPGRAPPAPRRPSQRSPATPAAAAQTASARTSTTSMASASRRTSPARRASPQTARAMCTSPTAVRCSASSTRARECRVRSPAAAPSSTRSGIRVASKLEPLMAPGPTRSLTPFTNCPSTSTATSSWSTRTTTISAGTSSAPALSTRLQAAAPQARRLVIKMPLAPTHGFNLRGASPRTAHSCTSPTRATTSSVRLACLLGWVSTMTTCSARLLLPRM